MADIKVRIELNENAESEKIGSVKTDNLTFANTSIEPNSDGVFNNMPTRDNITKGINALTFGQGLYFNENGVLDNVDGYGAGLDSEKNKFEIVWGIVNSDNTYNVKITFEKAQNLKDIVIYGDKESRQFPTRAILDGTTEVFSDDYIWTLQFENESNTHTIEFTHWNRANYNAVLTFIGVMLNHIEVDKRNGLKSVESLSQSTGQPKEIFYGVVPSSGSLEIIDLNGEIADMVKEGILPSANLDLEIISNNGNVQKHVSTDTTYDVAQKTFNVNLSNDFEKLANINIPTHKSVIEDFRYVEQEESLGSSLYDILGLIMPYLEIKDSIDNLCSNYIVDSNKDVITIKEYLSNINYKSFEKLKTLGQYGEALNYIHYTYFDSNNAQNILNMICEIAQLNLIKLDSGENRFVMARPTLLPTQKIISIPFKNQFGSFEYDLVSKKYDNVNYTEKTIESMGTKEVFNSTYRYIEEGEFVAPIGLENAQIIKYNGNIPYLCFFLTVSSNGKVLYFRHPREAFHFAEAKFSDDEQESPSTQTWGIPPSNLQDSNETKETFDFESHISPFATAYRLTKYSKLNSETFAFMFMIGGFVNSYTNFSLKINATELNEQSLSKNYNNKTNVFSLSSNNELLTNNLYYKEHKMYDILSNNIISDYRQGIITGKISVSCLDYYDINGNLTKNWVDGEILQLEDVIRIDKDNLGNSQMKYSDGSDMYFKITGRRFIYGGVPTLDLELQEVRDSNRKIMFNSSCSFSVSSGYPLQTMERDRYFDMYINDQKVLMNSIINVYKGDIIKITTKKVGSYQPISATINDLTYTFGTEYIVYKDVEFRAKVAVAIST